MLLSGGAYTLDDASLEMVVSKCQQTQRERNPAALTIDDATYLQAYLNICEGLIDRLLKNLVNCFLFTAGSCS